MVFDLVYGPSLDHLLNTEKNYAESNPCSMAARLAAIIVDDYPVLSEVLLQE
jgi:hypothetical protein